MKKILISLLSVFAVVVLSSNIYSYAKLQEKKAKYNSIILAPYFAFESEKWAKNIGVKIDFWSEQEHEKFKDYFMNKYKHMMK